MSQKQEEKILTDEHAKAVKEKIVADKKKKAMDELTLDENQQKNFEDILKEAKMPIELKDGDFQLGEKELDIRSLKDENKLQMIFRTLVLNNVYLKQMTQMLLDVTRLMYAMLKAMGVSGDNLVDAVDLTMYEIEKVIKKRLEKDKKSKN